MAICDFHEDPQHTVKDLMFSVAQCMFQTEDSVDGARDLPQFAPPSVPLLALFDAMQLATATATI